MKRSEVTWEPDDPISHLMQTEGLRFPEAVEELAHRRGVRECDRIIDDLGPDTALRALRATVH